jgi:hypothetical protein
MIKIKKPVARVRFEASEVGRPTFDELIDADKLRAARKKP